MEKKSNVILKLLVVAGVLAAVAAVVTVLITKCKKNKTIEETEEVIIEDGTEELIDGADEVEVEEAEDAE